MLFSQDINIASNVSRVLAARDVSQPQRSIHVTSLMASRGLLWVGTNVGIALTVPLPRLEGVPIISGRANISYHAHFGPVTFFLNVQHKVISADLPDYYHSQASAAAAVAITGGDVFHDDPEMIREESEQDLQESEDNSSLASFDNKKNVAASQNSLDKAVAPSQQQQQQASPALPTAAKKASTLRHRNSSPPLRARPRIRQFGDQSEREKRFSKTLPRGFSLANSEAANHELSDVYGLYGDLLNVTDYSFDAAGEGGSGGPTCPTGGGGKSAANKAQSTHHVCAMNDENRKSDPEISTIPYRVSTLDRRMRMKSSRPRSLDMSSTWSMDSRGSSVSGGLTSSTNGSSSSESGGSERPSPCVSRNASFQSNNSCASHTMTSSSSSTSSSAVDTTAAMNGGGGGGTNSYPTHSSAAVASSLLHHRQQPMPPLPKPPSKSDIPKIETPKTVTTLMGGRGYINWRRTSLEKQRTAAVAQINNFDAFLVIWEMKT